MTEKVTTDDIYRFIVRYQQGHGGVPPSYKQIGEFAGIDPRGPVAHHIRKLREQGLVTSDESGRTYATGGVWLSPEQVDLIERELQRSPEALQRVTRKFWELLVWVVGKPTHIRTMPKEPLTLRGEDLTPLEE